MFNVDKRKISYVISLICISVLIAAGPVSARDEPSAPGWDIYLDHAYELTYWDEKELQVWIGQRGSEIGQTLAEYADGWHKQLTGLPESAGTEQPDSGSAFFSETVYQRLAVADLLLYLSSGEYSRLGESGRIIKLLKSKFEKPEISFWYFFIRAHEAMSNKHAGVENGSEQFVRYVFRIWLDIVLPREEAHAALNIPNIAVSMRDFSFSLPYLYENIADLIVSRAIIRQEMQRMGPLGVIVHALNDRLSVENGYAEKIRTIVNRMSGPKSDMYHLNYTVTFLEAEEYRFEAQKNLNEAGPSLSAEEAYEKAQYYYHLAYTWANTRQGRAAALSDYLDLLSFAFSRFPAREKLPPAGFFAGLNEHDGLLTIDKAVQLYEELAGPEIRRNKWDKQGFPRRKDYVEAMHSLWNSIVELSLWSAYYREKSITSRDIELYSNRIVPAQRALQLYLNFFDRNIKNGYLDIIPDSAYFNATEAAAKYADLYYRLAPYRPGMTNYYHSFVRLLQYVEIFPYNPEAIIELARQLNKMGKPDLYVQYVLPVADRVKQSPAIQKWKPREQELFIDSIKTLQTAIPEIILKANTLIYLQSKGAETVKDAITSKITKIQQEGSRLLDGRDLDLGPENFSGITDKLNTLVPLLTRNVSGKEEMNSTALVEEIKKIKREIRELQEAEHLLARLPRYIEDSRRLRRDLAQKVDHSMHEILRQFFHELPTESTGYHQTGSLIKGKNK